MNDVVAPTEALLLGASLAASLVANPTTREADALPVVNRKIGTVQVMPSEAVGFARRKPPLWVSVPHSFVVHGGAHGFQMLRIAAGLYATEMIKLRIFGDLSAENDIGYTVRLYSVPTDKRLTDIHLTIAICHNSSLPEPAFAAVPHVLPLYPGQELASTHGMDVRREAVDFTYSHDALPLGLIVQRLLVALRALVEAPHDEGVDSDGREAGCAPESKNAPDELDHVHLAPSQEQDAEKHDRHRAEREAVKVDCHAASEDCGISKSASETAPFVRAAIFTASGREG